ncbi:MAG TPA: TPM domain-containing protein [Candidatus Limnocylindrales bacterium]|nr:TPM domain-containing protein [Candidatus Limnocylindrales bacterium]
MRPARRVVGGDPTGPLGRPGPAWGAASGGGPLRRLVLAALGGAGLLVLAAATVLAAGPPFPARVPGRVVYDTAGVFRPATIEQATATIEGIAQRTGAEVIVYTQVKPESDTTEAAQADADALGTSWGVGRRGFDDGLVILFDLDESKCHGQIQLDAGSGYAAAFLDNGERQAIYEDDMLPLLHQCDLDGALLVALQKVDANATPAHAQKLELARQINAVVGLIGAPAVFLILAGWAYFHWRRFGKDPVYLDDPSIHMPAPPPDLTAASGALVATGRSTRRDLTAALLDLASRGYLRFDEDKRLTAKDVTLHVLDREAPVSTEMQLARRRPLGQAEDFAYEQLAQRADDGLVDKQALLDFGRQTGEFDKRLEQHVLDKGWFTEAPGKVIRRWTQRGIIEIILAAVGLFGGSSAPASGLILLCIGLAAAGAVTLVLARWMPARTMPGAMIAAMLAAYRRTLEKTMLQARSMDQVVKEAGLAWLESPDQAFVWSVALGLEEQAQAVVERTVTDVQAGTAQPGSSWIPVWYGSGGSGGHSFASTSGAAGGLAPGLMSTSAVPDIGGMMAAISSIGDVPSSSGGGGGGGGGFGGGGAGGGF